MISGILHTLRNEEDLVSILRNGLRPNSNITIDSSLPNQSFTGDGITLLYDKSDIKFKSKGYNSNDGLVIKHLNYTPKAILIGADEFREDDDNLDDDQIAQTKTRKDFLDKNIKSLSNRLNSKIHSIKSKIDSLIYIEDIKDNSKIHKFLYPKTRNGEYINALDITNIRYASIRDLYKIMSSHGYIFKDTDIPKLANLYDKMKDKLSRLTDEFQYLKNLNYDDIIKNRNRIDIGRLKAYINSLNLPTNIPIFYYTSNLNGTGNIKKLNEHKMTQLEIIKLLENMNDPQIFKVISGDGYIYETQLHQINKFDGKKYGELLDGQELILFDNGQIVKKSDFNRDKLVIHKHTKNYGEFGKLKEDGLVPMIFVKYYPNLNYKSGYVPQQVIERI